MREVLLFAVLASTYLMVIAKRLPALICAFRYQSFFLFLLTLAAGFSGHRELYVIALLILILKVFLIPNFLSLTIKRIKVDENLGMFINAQLSLLIAVILSCCSWIFAQSLNLGRGPGLIAVTCAFSVIFIGAFLMAGRMKALTQVIGLLVMENGIFLFASTLSGGMPFLVEIAVFLDVFVSVIIMGIFVYRINRFFTHIDVNKLSRLKG